MQELWRNFDNEVSQARNPVNLKPLTRKDTLSQAPLLRLTTRSHILSLPPKVPGTRLLYTLALKVVPIYVLGGQSIYYLGTRTLRRTFFKIMDPNKPNKNQLHKVTALCLSHLLPDCASVHLELPP